jgi:hypothetical protein
LARGIPLRVLGQLTLGGGDIAVTSDIGTNQAYNIADMFTLVCNKKMKKLTIGLLLT